MNDDLRQDVDNSLRDMADFYFEKRGVVLLCMCTYVHCESNSPLNLLTDYFLVLVNLFNTIF